jgi:hypothetical protein
VRSLIRCACEFRDRSGCAPTTTSRLGRKTRKINALENNRTVWRDLFISVLRNFDHEWRVSRMKAVEQFPEINGLAT